ncbi:MAG: c-type cytochrome biogenesis protein CcsB, partial [Thermodesulfobacteriota bacterium]|nr:c-type cytochrome biogenesis protein CcsB [Thermodesulfobacteriota bacterium]
MDIVIIITILFYALSTTGYVTYLLFQKNYLHQTGFYLLAAGFLCHSAAIGYVFIKSGVIPVHNL